MVADGMKGLRALSPRRHVIASTSPDSQQAYKINCRLLSYHLFLIAATTKNRIFGAKMGISKKTKI